MGPINLFPPTPSYREFLAEAFYASEQSGEAENDLPSPNQDAESGEGEQGETLLIQRNPSAFTSKPLITAHADGENGIPRSILKRLCEAQDNEDGIIKKKVK